MKVNLVVARGKQEGKVLPISGPQFIIGRHKECQLRASGTTISQHHCAILVKENKVLIHDFDSTNGTFVNRHRVHGEQELNSNDLLELGRLAFRIRIEIDAEDPDDPALAPKSDDSVIGEMLLSANETEQGILGLLDDSRCGSTIMRKPDYEVEDSENSEEEASGNQTEESPEPEDRKPGDDSPLPADANDQIAKKLLEELHRSVRAKHNPPS
jgi:hypothetical protein